MRSLQISCSEDVVEMWLQRSLLLIAAHSNAANCYRMYHYIVGISIIILSGAMTFPCARSFGAYLGSLTVILASIYVFLGLNDTAAQHRRASKGYGEIIRALEAQKGSGTLDPLVLQRVQDTYNKVNAEAPNVPQKIFDKLEASHRADAEDIKKSERQLPPRLIKNVNFVSLPALTQTNLGGDHFRIEIEHFGKYAICPATLEAFRDKYKDSPLSMTEARIDGKLIGYCIFESISDKLWHLVIVIISQSFRKQGIGKQLMTTACEQLAVQGMKFFSLFTADDALISRLLRGIADPVGVATELNPDEIHALDRIAEYRNLTPGEYGKRRCIPKYYTLRDGSTLDATFKLYKI